jgi:hypothetical protein
MRIAHFGHFFSSIYIYRFYKILKPFFPIESGVCEDNCGLWRPQTRKDIGGYLIFSAVRRALYRRKWYRVEKSEKSMMEIYYPV